jgi:Resolvase, N terminal domain
MTTGTTAPAAAQSPASCGTARDVREESGRGLLRRAAWYARVSTDTQEREATVASPVDLLQEAAEPHGYAVLPGHVCIADGISGTRLDRPALER